MVSNGRRQTGIFKKGILWRIIRLPKRVYQKTRENCVMRSFAIRSLHKILQGQSKQLGSDGLNLKHACKRSDMCTKFWLKDVKKKVFVENLDIERIILK